MKSSLVPLALGAACAALFCLVRRQKTTTGNFDIEAGLRQIHKDLFLQRRLSIRTRLVLNDAQKLIHAVSKGLEKQPS